jgi:hypothetical protein
MKRRKIKEKYFFVLIEIHLNRSYPFIYIGWELLPRNESFKPSKLSLKSKSDPVDFG